MPNARISGIAAYTPDYKLTNDELSRMVDTNDEWITTRVGIKERRIQKTPGLGSSHMGMEAVNKLLAETGTDKEEGPTGVAIQMPLIQMPLSIFTESQLQNLYDLVAAKGSLIKKALGVSELPINIEGKKLDFSWFPKYESPDEVKAYMHFVTALCDMARNQKRITAKEKPVDHDKYAFRCFLLRLGFIGNEYKAERKVLLRNLTGSSAFKSGAKKTEVETCE